MSLPREPVFSLLESDFVVGWHNIIEKEYVGESFGYTCEQTSVGTSNGAGPHNVQMFVLAEDLTVLHALPGFWHPEDLAQELRFAKVLHRLWNDKSRSRQQKDELFQKLQLAEFKLHSAETTARSGWQGFDAANERRRITSGQKRDTVLTASLNAKDGKKRRKAKMKPINQLVHERMAQRPFVPFGEFDTAEFADYGRVFYDNNKRVDGKGRVFQTPRRAAKIKVKEERKRKSRERREKILAERRGRRAKALAQRRGQQAQARAEWRAKRADRKKIH